MTLFMAATALTFCFPSPSRWPWRGGAPHAGCADRPTAIVHTVRGLPLIMFIFWTYFFCRRW